VKLPEIPLLPSDSSLGLSPTAAVSIAVGIVVAGVVVVTGTATGVPTPVFAATSEGVPPASSSNDEDGEEDEFGRQSTHAPELPHVHVCVGPTSASPGSVAG